ncbi:TIGR02147 family protein [Fibrobacter sp. UWCM]|uniref:TIGR02147 family protein n=1 Tax=Fibrobacter sp. UWCM TaxID=1896208 RepID=UPI000916C020|nr:TIGR02147 family protein [Fibrobacter sp. UWCM]SHG49954.1 TIGR02147 family protein [Fibrobacter sp. UWCM]
MNDVSKNSAKIKNVFMYFDYREYIRDVLETLQKDGLSLRAIQESAGLSGSAFFTRILDGSRPLSTANAKTLVTAWGMGEDEAEYFMDMVKFGNERDVDRREGHLKKLLAVRSRNREYALQDSTLKFFSKWYYPVLRDLLPLVPAGTSAERIGRMFTPALRAPQVQSGIDYLVEAGFIAIGEDGKYAVTSPIVSTPPRVRSTILRKYHLKNLEINAEVYDSFTSDDRSITSVTCSLSKEGFEKVREEIAALREKILAIAREDKSPDRVCHVGFQLVPRAKEAK